MAGGLDAFFSMIKKKKFYQNKANPIYLCVIVHS